MASKEDHRLCRENDDTGEACDTGVSSQPTDSAFSTDKHTPLSPSSHGKLMQHKPLTPGVSSYAEKDTQQEPLRSNPFSTLENSEEVHQTPLTSRQASPSEHDNDTHKRSLRAGSSATTGSCEKTCQKTLDSFASADETNPKTHLAVSHSIIQIASDDSDDESLQKPKYNTHVMLPDRQNLERHAGTLIDIYNDIHTESLAELRTSTNKHVDDITRHAGNLQEGLRRQAEDIKVELRRPQQMVFDAEEKRDLKRRLAEWYQKEYNHVPFIPSMQEYEVSMRQLYVAPKIVEKDDKNNSEVRIKTFTDFLMKDGCLCKNIFLVGEPGTGKSTFTQNLALQWSELQLQSVLVAGDAVVESDDDFQDKSTLNMIDILLHVSLRNANGLCSYVDIVRDQLLVHIYSPSELDQATTLVQSVLECPTSCILSDGLDEWSHPEQGRCSCPFNMKGRTPVICQPHSAITITTSRPWRMSQCPPKESMVEKRIYIEGTGNVYRLGEKVVNILNERSKNHVLFSEIEYYVWEKDVSHLLTIPILLLQIVCLFFDGKEVSNSQSKIYANIFDMILGRQPQDSTGKKSSFDPKLRLFADKKNVIRYWTYFTEIAKLAFQQLFPQHGHSSVVFNSNTCHLNSEVKRFALKYGVLSEKQTKSFSCRSSNLTFIHKSLQEFLAAVHMGLHEDLFEIAVEPRYSFHNVDDFYSYISDLSQVFIFMCGLNIVMAEKMSEIMNKHVQCGNEIGRIYFPHQCHECTLTHLIKQGLMEADKNGFENFRPTLYYISSSLENNQDHDILYRLMEVNKTRVISVTVQHSFGRQNNVVLRYPSLASYTCLTTLTLGNNSIDGFLIRTPSYVTVSFGLEDNVLQLDHGTVSGVVSIENCARLEKLTLDNIDLKDNMLKLPASITNIGLDHVTVRGGVALENCTRLEELILKHVDKGDHNLQLSSSITSIYLDHVTMSEGVVLKNCTRLESLTIIHSDIGDINQLSTSVKFINFYHVTVSGGVSLENCSGLEELTLKHVDIRDDNLQLPASITRIILDHVTLTGGISLEKCTRLLNLTLKYVDVGDHNLQLPASITSIDLDHVTVSGGVSLENCTRLEWITLAHIDLKDVNLMLSASTICIDLDHVTLTGGVSLDNCTSLQTITMQYIDLGDHTLQFPASVTHINLNHVTVRGGVSLENVEWLFDLTMQHVDMGEHNLMLPESHIIESMFVEHVNMSAGFSPENCTWLD